MSARTSGGVATWIALAVFVCGTIALSSALVARANPSSATLRDRLLESPPPLPSRLQAREDKRTSSRVEEHESVIFMYRGDWFEASLRYEIYDEGPAARDVYLGHRDGDRLSAISSMDPANRAIPPRHSARFFPTTPGVLQSFCRTTGRWYAECVANPWRINVVAEVRVDPRGEDVVLPDDVIGHALAKAQALLRVGNDHIEQL